MYNDGLTYAQLFQKKYVYSRDLRSPAVMDLLREKGFQWIRPREGRQFHEILRNPTVGVNLEMFIVRHVDCVHVDSRQGQKLIWSDCNKPY
jgi:hypothetical protein